MPNLVKQRFIIEDKEQARVINSNEKMMELIGHDETDGFTPGLFAQHVDVSSPEGEHREGLSGIEALLADPDNPAGVSFSDAEEPYGQDPIEQIEESAEEILQQAHIQAEEILSEARMNAKQEADTVRQQAYEQGVLLAQEESETIRQRQQEEYQAMVMQQESDYQQQLEQMEPMLVDSILSVIQDVLHVKIEDYRPIILDLVLQTMMQADNPREFSIYANAENCVYMKENIDRLRAIAGEGSKIEILPNQQLSEEECRIETEFGIYDCGFDVQLKNLSDRIRLLSRQKE